MIAKLSFQLTSGHNRCSKRSSRHQCCSTGQTWMTPRRFRNHRRPPSFARQGSRFDCARDPRREEIPCLSDLTSDENQFRIHRVHHSRDPDAQIARRLRERTCCFSIARPPQLDHIANTHPARRNDLTSRARREFVSEVASDRREIRCVRFEAAARAAHTLGAMRIDCDMTEFAGGVVRSADHLSARDDRRTHSVRYRHVNEALRRSILAATDPYSCQRRGNRRVLDLHRQSGCFCERIANVHVTPSELWRANHPAGLAVHHSRYDQSDSLAPVRGAVLCQHSGDALRQLRHKLRWISNRRKTVHRDRAARKITEHQIGHRQPYVYCDHEPVPRANEEHLGTPAAWSDPTRGAELAKAQFARGVDVVFAAAGGTGVGVYQAAKDAGKLAIGVDSNQNHLQPGTMLTSMVKRVDTAVYNSSKKSMPGVTVLGLKEGGVDYAMDQYNAKLVSADMKSKVDAAKAEPLLRAEKSGARHLPTGSHGGAVREA